MTVKALNLYAGIGGNRKYWSDVEVTAVEINNDIADIYANFFPDDEVVVADAHEFLRDNYSDYDFIWSSPPCVTHSRLNLINNNIYNSFEPRYPDMNLYQEIILLQSFYEGNWVVENTKSYYQPLIKPQIIHRHYFWSNCYISDIDIQCDNVRNTNTDLFESRTGFDADKLNDIEGVRKEKVMQNTMTPKLGEHVFNEVAKNKQSTLSEI